MFCTLRIRLKFMLCFAAAALICIAACVFGAYADKDQEKNEGIFVPIIMYHSILKDESATGEYVVTPMQVEQDFLYLDQHGYTPVFINDLIRYVRYDGELPEKPVVITFDDGSYNNFTYLMPLLEKYDFKASVSVVGEYTVTASESGEEPNPAYSYLRLSDINEMRDSGYVEICNHTYAMHSIDGRKGVKRNPGESYEEYRGIFINDIFELQQLLEENCRFRPNVFTYPFGFHDESSERLVKNCGFEASLGVEEKPNYIIKGDEKCLFDLNRYNRSGFADTEDFMKKALAE
ncbi:MAG: polysaccharide deacetylase family protein [Ruminococcus sp.]|nr:polysaccharide deacetylase family protein [Ruminococcus sp.]